MPVTPFHFGPGAAIHAAAPRYVSFIAFCAANILMDIEPLYYMLRQQYPLHRFFRTYIGASLGSAGSRPNEGGSAHSTLESNEESAGPPPLGRNPSLE
jgi:hypothetical protein